MVLHVLRALFILVMASVGWLIIKTDPKSLGELAVHSWLAIAVAVVLAVLIVCVDILSPRRKLAIFSGTFLGLLVGICIAFALSFVTAVVFDQVTWFKDQQVTEDQRRVILSFVNLVIAVSSCYLAISFILQTKDDFRFVIPYVEFSKQTKGARPLLLDTSVLIDGRIKDIAATGIIENNLIVPQFVLHELQMIADSPDRLKRNRGRRGLDVVRDLKGIKRVDVVIYDSSGREDKNLSEADDKLMALAKDLNARVLTNDFNLNKVATLRGVDVINVNELANALKPDLLPGENMTVKLIKPGDSPGQGVGYLDDGTMVVVEAGKSYIGEELDIVVTNTRQTVQGRMIFARPASETTPAPQSSPSHKKHQPQDAA